MRKKIPTRNAFIKLIKDDYFVLPAFSALLIGLSRYPIKLNFLVFFGFIPLLFLINNYRRIYKPARGRKIITAALSFSTVYTLVALHWIAVVTIPGFFGLFILFGFYFIILFFVIFKVKAAFPRLGNLITITSWLSFDWLQNYGEFRFPWFNTGYSIADYTILAQAAEYGGVFLLSLLILLVNVLLYMALRSFPARYSHKYLSAAALLFMVWFGTGFYRYKNIELQEKELTVSIVQVSIPQYIKWNDAFFDDTLALYKDYTLAAAQSNPDLIIWPEAAIPDYVLQSRSSAEFVEHVVSEAGVPIFLGMPHYELTIAGNSYHRRFYNAATLFGKNGAVSKPYFKNILVPVGERIPFMDYIPFLGNLDFGQANWEYGEEPVFFQIDKDNQNYTFAPLICFEIAFPNFVRKITADDPDFFVNITNDAWFERTIGPYQHGMMTVIRAIETRTQFYRAANTGISMIVTPKGEITKKTALFEQTHIEGNLNVYDGKTVYGQWFGSYPVIFLVITSILIIMAALTFISVKKL